MTSTQSWGSQWWQFWHTPGHAVGVGIACDHAWSLGRRHWWPATTLGIPLWSQQRQCPALCRHGGKGYNLTSFSSCPPNDGDWPGRWSRCPLRIATSHSFTGFPLPQSVSTRSASVLSPGLIPEAQVPASIPLQHWRTRVSGWGARGRAPSVQCSLCSGCHRQAALLSSEAQKPPFCPSQPS